MTQASILGPFGMISCHGNDKMDAESYRGAAIYSYLQKELSGISYLHKPNTFKNLAHLRNSSRLSHDVLM